MPDFSSVSIPRPRDWPAFERQCRVLFKHVLGDPGTQTNGRSGQRQHGVDIFGREGGVNGPLVGIQCKGKDANYGGRVTENELRREVEKTKDFLPPIKRFILVTTADDDVLIQEKARLLENEVRATGRDLSIAVWGWGTLQQHISEYPEAIRVFHPDASPFTDEIISGQRQIQQFLEESLTARLAGVENLIKSIVLYQEHR